MTLFIRQTQCFLSFSDSTFTRESASRNHQVEVSKSRESQVNWALQPRAVDPDTTSPYGQGGYHTLRAWSNHDVARGLPASPSVLAGRARPAPSKEGGAPRMKSVTPPSILG